MRATFAAGTVLTAHTLQARCLGLIDEACCRPDSMYHTACSCNGSKPMSACDIMHVYACTSQSKAPLFRKCWSKSCSRKYRPLLLLTPPHCCFPCPRSPSHPQLPLSLLSPSHCLHSLSPLAVQCATPSS